ncbi:cytidine and dCMP deaminase domain-containing protein 1 isoform X3 [Bufo gargarizans]|uniref:cytidine and dCMP deaminase domain-containing protein 1 isoform X3 n=1 Tax=Bufo gargarizans TaxID=30331 RepID=UPI001CF36DE6|nr:cytidine and dCMP deaminase domain-containing protein 1 isoform X3 [Bufo gargarizans]
MYRSQEPACCSTGTQTDSMQGQVPRLSKVNLFTLLSLWMEVFPSPKDAQDKEKPQQIKKTGLVVVRNMKIIGLHCSSSELHAGQIAVIKHGSRLKDCDLYFSRKPCSTCLKMIVNAGVNRISYWPSDPEMSLQQERSSQTSIEDARLDAKAVERLKSNSRAHVCVLLQPLACYMVQFVEETSLKCDFIQKITKIEPEFTRSTFYEYRQERVKEYESLFLISNEDMHKEILRLMGLENLCEDPYFVCLRQNMKDLVLILATVAASVPSYSDFGFYLSKTSDGSHQQGLTQEIAQHCIIQARLLAYRTDHKIGVGAVIWAERKSSSLDCDGTGSMYFIGCGYNAFPVGSEYADFPHMDDNQKDREIRKFRYIIHAEQNAITFRCQEINLDEQSMIFVTKCPCDECVPLIKGAGIKQIYTGDMDSGKKKADISYMKFSELRGVGKYSWQQNPHRASTSNTQASMSAENGDLKNKDEDDLCFKNKRMCYGQSL